MLDICKIGILITGSPMSQLFLAETLRAYADRPREIPVVMGYDDVDLSFLQMNLVTPYVDAVFATGKRHNKRPTKELGPRVGMLYQMQIGVAMLHMMHCHYILKTESDILIRKWNFEGLHKELGTYRFICAGTTTIYGKTCDFQQVLQEFDERVGIDESAEKYWGIQCAKLNIPRRWMGESALDKCMGATDLQVQWTQRQGKGRKYTWETGIGEIWPRTGKNHDH